ncbi:MAG: hypothetical protein H8E34_08290 [Bacteroidetes bacterium]|nr:hypothetical protein [Bacteroidota bacterium]MBL6944478.1 hypothetical protein [Bacteroidales bacterium]
MLIDKDAHEFANIRKFPEQTEICPYENSAKRNTARRIVKQLKAIHPKATQNLFRSMKNIDEEYLP